MYFLVAGFQTTTKCGSRRRIAGEMKSLGLTVNREGKLHEQHIAFFAKLGSFRQMQGSYMLGAKALIDEEEEGRDSNEAMPVAEDVKLWMLSQVPNDERIFVCEDALFEAECRLHEGQCSDALTSLQTELMAHQHLIRYRNANIVGQRMST